MWLLKFFTTSHVRLHSLQRSTLFVTNWQLWHGHAYTTESNFHMDSISVILIYLVIYHISYHFLWYKCVEFFVCTLNCVFILLVLSWSACEFYFHLPTYPVYLHEFQC